MENMFFGSMFNQDISDWNVSKVKIMRRMFYKSNFNQNIDTWTINPKCNIRFMFEDSKMEELPIWYK